MSSSGPRRNPFLPNWVYDLRGLTDYVGYLTDLAKNPVGTLRNTVRTILSVIVVGGVLDMGRSIIDALLAVGEALLLIPQSVVNLLGGAGSAVSSTILSAGTWYIDSVGAVAASMGPFGIILQVTVYVMTAVLLIQAIPPLLNALSDLLGAVPVLGSVLDAILTFAVGLGSALSGLVGGDS